MSNRTYTAPYKSLLPKGDLSAVYEIISTLFRETRLIFLLSHEAGVKEFCKAKIRYVTIENGVIRGEIVIV